jgi:hypothetical protein
MRVFLKKMLVFSLKASSLSGSFEMRLQLKLNTRFAWNVPVSHRTQRPRLSTRKRVEARRLFGRSHKAPEIRSGVGETG